MRLFELDTAHHGPARSLFAAAPYERALLDAFFEGRQPGRLFVDDPERPSGALLCRTYDYFVAGEPAGPLRRFIADAPEEAEVFVTRVESPGPPEGPAIAFYGIVPLTVAWRETLLDDHDGRLDVVARRSFRFDPARAGDANEWRRQVPCGFTVRPLDAALTRLVDTRLDEHIGVQWGGYAPFAEGGLGMCALYGKEPASAAYAIAVSASEANIGVGTGERFRRRGLATLVCRATIEAALERGLIPTWDCDAGNQASAALADTLGFVEGEPFVELAFPNRRGPERSAGRWTSEECSFGRVWTRW